MQIICLSVGSSVNQLIANHFRSKFEFMPECALCFLLVVRGSDVMLAAPGGQSIKRSVCLRVESVCFIVFFFRCLFVPESLGF